MTDARVARDGSLPDRGSSARDTTKPSSGNPLPERGLGLALEILEQVARSDRSATAADLARAVGAPRATVYRIVNSLVRDEYLVRRADFSGFLLGARVLELAAVVGERRRPGEVTIVEDLRRSTGEAIHLFRMHRDGIVLLDEDPTHPLSDPATLFGDPLSSAIGHVWIVERPAQADPGSPGWRIPVREADRLDLTEAYAVRGYAEQAAQLVADRGCIAVPITAPSAGVVGGIALSTTTSRLALAARHVGALREAAAALAELDVFVTR